MKRICKQCGREFTLTEQEIQFYQRKRLELPKRCKDCRKANRAACDGVPAPAPAAAPPKQERKPAKKKSILPVLVVAIALVAVLLGYGKSHLLDLLGGQSGTAPTSTLDGAVAAKTFRNEDLLQQHYRKHGVEMGFSSAEAYAAAADAVVQNPKALHKTEAEDGDDVYYVETTKEFVVVSTDGYIRTYYYADLDYFNQQ